MRAHASPEPSRAPSIRDRVRHRILSRDTAVAAGFVIVVIALTPLVRPLVDWGMDDGLTPGMWEPSLWWKGAFLSVCLLPVVTVGRWPIVAIPLILLMLVPIGVACRGRPRAGHCRLCTSPIDVSAGRCRTCGPIPPRRPRRAFDGALRRASTAILATLTAVSLTLLLASGLAWADLELEEDAFGDRARAAAASGATSHEERNRHGSLLAWTADHGYWSHRD